MRPRTHSNTNIETSSSKVPGEQPGIETKSSGIAWGNPPRERSVRECRVRRDRATRSRSGSRNEPPWETAGERGATTTFSPRRCRFSLLETRERKKAHARHVRSLLALPHRRAMRTCGLPRRSPIPFSPPSTNKRENRVAGVAYWRERMRFLENGIFSFLHASVQLSNVRIMILSDLTKYLKK